MVMFHPTLMFIDNVQCEFAVYFSTTTGEYWLRYRDNPLNTKKLGLNSYNYLDQVFINSMIRIINAFVLCQGKDVVVPTSAKDSTAIFQHEIADLGPNNQIINRRNVWMSKNCLGVLPLTCTKNNNTCDKCVHDINDRIRILKKKKGNASFEESNEMDVDGSKEDQSIEVDDDTDDDSVDPSQMGGAVRRSSADDENAFNQAAASKTYSHVKKQELTAKVKLTDADQKDFITIIKQVIPRAPHFKTLLENQLENCSAKDPRHRRWHPNVISLCLNLWAKCPNAYQDLRDSGFLILPSQRVLRYHKNKVKQGPGIIIDNLAWMYDEAVKKGGQSTFNGFLLLDEMSIQQDLQIVKRGRKWNVVGAVDLGPIVNSLDQLKDSKINMKMASHCFQYMYMGFNSFRWPVAYFGSDNVNGHSIYLTFWPLVDQLATFGFTVHGAIMDGSSNNRQFLRLLIDPLNARINKYTTTNPFRLNCTLSLIQDCKHVFKKICNSLLSSSPTGKWQICIHGKYIFWTFFQEAYEFNVRREWRYFTRLTRQHVYLTAQAKMRNHLATDVLGPQMLTLMQHYQNSLGTNGAKLEGLIELLDITSFMVTFFSNSTKKIHSVSDASITKLIECAHFFHNWENEYMNSKDQIKHLITKETRQDIDSCLYGFISLLTSAEKLKISLTPGYINSDLIENWFCQHRGLRNGFNQNPTLSQISGATNSNIITGSVVSSKGNVGGLSILHEGVMPPTKKFKSEMS